MEGIQSVSVDRTTKPLPSDLASRLDAAASRAGFLASGAVDLDAGLASPEFREHLAAYDRWLAARKHVPMEYLARGRDRKADPRLVFPAAQSVFCVLEPYSAHPLGGPDGPRFARYLRGRDYHERVAEKLDRVIREAAEPGLTYKVCVDTSAVLERTWAYLAGLGWVGKNTLLIHPQHGSYHFIGVALLSHPTGLAPRPIADRCGHCTRCLGACPTKALRFDENNGGRGLDATRCISTWNLETRGELALAESDRRSMGAWVAGCDLCQEACPFNSKRAKYDAPTEEGLPLPQEWTALEALAADPERVRAATRGSAIERVKPEMLARNVKIALQNRAYFPNLSP